MSKLLSLKDFTPSLNENIEKKVVSFQSYIDQMNHYDHNTYFIEATASTGSHMTIKHPYTNEDKKVISFVSNDYLGLSQHPETIAVGIEALRQHGTGACAATVIGGYRQIHHELESALAAFLEQEDAIVFSSGFGANEGVLKALLGKNDIALVDSFIHASALNGLSETNVKNIGHNDIEYLEKTLIDLKDKYTTKLVIVDGVYSQDGDIADLPGILAVCRKHGAQLMVDDAHGIGVYGESGKGIVEHFGLLGQIDIITGTLSKSFGCVGGFVAASKQMIQYMKYYAPHNLFSAALPPSTTASALKALEIIEKATDLRAKLWDNVAFMRSEMERIGADIVPSESQIFPVKVRNNNKTRDVGAQLIERGIYTSAITFPAVREKDSRMRVSVLATHSHSDITALAEALKEIL